MALADRGAAGHDVVLLRLRHARVLARSATLPERATLHTTEVVP